MDKSVEVEHNNQKISMLRLFAVNILFIFMLSALIFTIVWLLGYLLAS